MLCVMVSIERHSVTLAEGTSYLEAGSGPALVLLHSFGADANLWRPQLTEFAAGHHVVAPDLRGHGDTSWTGGLSPGQMARDLIGLTDQLGLPPFVAVGLSMGANVALQAAVLAPHRVRALVLASAFTEPLEPLQRVLLGMAREAERVIDMNEYARQRAERMLRGSDHATDGFMLGARRASKATLVHLGRALAHWKLTSLLKVVRVPTLVIRGADDPFVTAEITADIAARLLDTQVVTIPGAGHICNVDAPAEFNAALRGFLAGLREAETEPHPPSS